MAHPRVDTFSTPEPHHSTGRLLLDGGDPRLGWFLLLRWGASAFICPEGGPSCWWSSMLWNNG